MLGLGHEKTSRLGEKGEASLLRIEPPGIKNVANAGLDAAFHALGLTSLLS
jgi:hypothetical protein